MLPLSLIWATIPPKIVTLANTGSDVATIANAIPPSITATPPLTDEKSATAAKVNGNAEGATIVAVATETNAYYETDNSMIVTSSSDANEIVKNTANDKIQNKIDETVTAEKFETEIAETVATEKLETEIAKVVTPETLEKQNAESLSVQNANKERIIKGL